MIGDKHWELRPVPGPSGAWTIAVSGEKPQIVKKKVVLQNDYIHHVVDIYHV